MTHDAESTPTEVRYTPEQVKAYREAHRLMDELRDKFNGTKHYHLASHYLFTIERHIDKMMPASGGHIPPGPTGSRLHD